MHRGMRELKESKADCVARAVTHGKGIGRPPIHTTTEVSSALVESRESVESSWIAVNEVNRGAEGCPSRVLHCGSYGRRGDGTATASRRTALSLGKGFHIPGHVDAVRMLLL